jgi:antitoxin (DNA-binding transcriptional repressor) of toxin-antitoxin stability system
MRGPAGRGRGGPARLTGSAALRNLNVLNVMYPGSVREMGIQEARPILGDLVRDAQRHGIETRITRNGSPAARIARLGDPGDDAAECEKILAGYADDPGLELTGPEREAIGVVRSVLTGMVDKERDAR